MARILITRLSSFGDVAMLVPVVFSIATKYPQDRFVILTRKSFAPLFENLGFNINAVTFDVKRHGGFLGTMKLFRSISSSRYSHVADVHNVLRTKIIRTYMAMLGKKGAHIEKGKPDKQRMIASKITEPPLKSTTIRYMEVFEKLGFQADMIFKNFFEFDNRTLYPLRAIVTEKTGNWVGIAPFSKHNEKIYPLERMEKIVAALTKNPAVTIFLFGSGSDEKEILQKWADKYPHTISVFGRINLINELLLISYLDVMVSMDSANMHLASLVETPVVSIWGATHPSLGFYGFGQSLDYAVQTNIECRPCSVYGEIPCSRGDYACLTRIRENSILDKIESFFKKENYSITDKTKTPIEVVEQTSSKPEVIEEANVEVLFSGTLNATDLDIQNEAESETKDNKNHITKI